MVNGDRGKGGGFALPYFLKVLPTRPCPVALPGLPALALHGVLHTPGCLAGLAGLGKAHLNARVHGMVSKLRKAEASLSKCEVRSVCCPPGCLGRQASTSRSSSSFRPARRFPVT